MELLDNGLKAILRPLSSVPQVSLWTVYRVGSRNEAPGMTGSTHWVEHMLFKGGGKLGKGDLDRLISRVGGKYNGFTDKDWTMYYETVPAEHLETALFVESERMRNAAFDPKEFDAERTVVISEREGSENQPEFLVEEEMWGTAFHVHPYHWLPIGYKQDLARMARDEVYAWYRRWYAPNNAVLVLVGGFDADRAVAMVHTYFDPLRPEPAPPAPRFEEPAQMGERGAEIRRPGEVDHVEVAWKIPEWAHADTPRIVMLTGVLGGWRGFGLAGSGGWTPRANRLYRGLVEAGLVSDVRAGFEMRLDPSLLTVSASLIPGVRHREVERRLEGIVAKLREAPPTVREMERSRELVRAWNRYEEDGVTSQGFMIGQLEVLGSRETFPAFIDRVLAVTPEEVRLAAETYLVDRTRTAVRYHAESPP